MPIVIETAREFAERHGGNPVQLHDDGGTPEPACVFPDGAVWRVDNNNSRREPPQDPWELLRVKKRYFAELLRRATQDFKTLRRDCLEMVENARTYANLPYPDAPAVEDLKRLKGLVQEYTKSLDEVNKKLEDSPEAEARRRREQSDLRRQSRIAAIGAEIRAIEL